MKKTVVFILALFLLTTTQASATELSTLSQKSNGNASTTWSWGYNGYPYVTSNGFRLDTGNNGIEVCKSDFKLAKVGNPTDDVFVQIHKESYDGQLVAISNSVNGFGMTTNHDTYVSFFFGEGASLGLNCAFLQPNTAFYFTLKRTGGIDASNYYQSHIYTGVNIPYSAHGYNYWQGSAHLLSGSDLDVIVTGYGGSAIIDTSTGIIDFNLQLPTMSCGAFQWACDALGTALNWTIGLIVPKQFDFSQYDQVNDLMNLKAPFAYTNTIWGFDTVTPASNAALPSFTFKPNEHLTLPNNIPITLTFAVPEQARQIFNPLRAYTSLFFWLALVVFMIDAVRRYTR
jgi:hypothetical protein